MPINALQQKAFNQSEEFRLQVLSEVKKQAIDMADALEPLDDKRAQLANVIKYPDQFQFPQTMVSDYDWTVTFDPWAENPPSADGAIQTFVTKHFGLLTGYYPLGPSQTQAQPEAPPPPASPPPEP